MAYVYLMLVGQTYWELLADRIEEFVDLLRWMYYMNIMSILLLGVIIILLIKNEDS